jgi:hypothetical protein
MSGSCHKLGLTGIRFLEPQGRDPRVLALVRLLQSNAYHEMLSELPGYDPRETGQTFTSWTSAFDSL